MLQQSHEDMFEEQRMVATEQEQPAAAGRSVPPHTFAGCSSYGLKDDMIFLQKEATFADYITSPQSIMHTMAVPDMVPLKLPEPIRSPLAAARTLQSFLRRKVRAQRPCHPTAGYGFQQI